MATNVGVREVSSEELMRNPRARISVLERRWLRRDDSGEDETPDWQAASMTLEPVVEHLFFHIQRDISDMRPITHRRGQRIEYRVTTSCGMRTLVKRLGQMEPIQRRSWRPGVDGRRVYPGLEYHSLQSFLLPDENEAVQRPSAVQRAVDEFAPDIARAWQ